MRAGYSASSCTYTRFLFYAARLTRCRWVSACQTKFCAGSRNSVSLNCQQGQINRQVQVPEMQSVLIKPQKSLYSSCAVHRLVLRTPHKACTQMLKSAHCRRWRKPSKIRGTLKRYCHWCTIWSARTWQLLAANIPASGTCNAQTQRCCSSYACRFQQKAFLFYLLGCSNESLKVY